VSNIQIWEREIHLTASPTTPGNVFKIANLLKASPDTRLHTIDIIGVGGVMSGLSAQRMKSAGSTAIALATALGREGIDVFERISREVLGEEIE
jgi:dihydroorotate dehydrogenase (fumarate)